MPGDGAGGFAANVAYTFIAIARRSASGPARPCRRLLSGLNPSDGLAAARRSDSAGISFERGDDEAMTARGEVPRHEFMHRCSAMPRQGVEVRRDDELSDADTPIWVLSIYREATEVDLEENHYLERVGEILWNTLLAIRHCPFCGERLSGDPDRDAFPVRHFDHTGRNMQERC